MFSLGSSASALNYTGWMRGLVIYLIQEHILPIYPINLPQLFSTYPNRKKKMWYSFITAQINSFKVKFVTDSSIFFKKKHTVFLIPKTLAAILIRSSL